MNTRLGKSFGLAFVVAVGILAVMFALGTFNAQKAGAATGLTLTIDGPSHAPASPVDLTIEYTIKEDATGTLTIELTNLVVAEGQASGSLKATVSGTAYVPAGEDPAQDPPGPNTPFSVEIADANYSAGGDLTVMVPADLFQVTGETAVVEESIKAGTKVTVKLVGQLAIGQEPDVVVATVTEAAEEDTASYDVRVNITAETKTPGAVSYIKIDVKGPAAIAIGDRVRVDFGSFGVPATISEESVEFRGGGTMDPESVTVSGKVVTMIVPDMNGDATGGGPLTLDYSIVFRSSAGVSVPTAADNYRVEVSHPGATGEDVFNEVPSNVVSIIETLSVDSDDGSRGTEVTLTGKGFANVQKVYVESGDEVGLDNEDHVLATDPTLTNNAFKVAFTADEGFSAGPNKIKVQDRADEVLDVTATFTVTGNIGLSADTAQPGDKLTVNFEDFVGLTINNDIDAGHQIGGQKVALTGDAAKSRTLEVPPGTSGGTKTVRIMVTDNAGTAKAYTATISITGLPLTVDPSTAVPGQDVTIRGDGFTPGAALQSIMIGGQPVDLGTTEILVSGGGNVIANVRVPKTVDVDGDNVLVEVKEYGDRNGDKKIEANQQEGNSRVGTTRMTIPEPTLTLNPILSRPDTTVTATGTGYVAGANVNIRYVDSTTSVNADSAGNWVKAFTVPINTRVPSENKVVAESGVGSGATEAEKSANATHEVPGGTLSVSPSSGLPGDSITITADGFQAYAPVVKITIGNLAIPHGGVNTDADGDFRLTVTLPALPEGTHSLFVGVGGTAANPANSDILVFTIASAGPATLPSADAFADLISANNLIVVWYFDNDTKGWSFYDPRPEVAAAVDLTMVTSGDNVWIQITADQMFQGEMLTAGWNLVTLN